MIDIMAIRQSYERRELQEVRWINGDDNPVDAMTKTKLNLSLETFINTNKLDIRVEGWVKRDGPVFTDRQNTDGSPEQEGECGQAVKRFESVFGRILTSICDPLCHMIISLFSDTQSLRKQAESLLVSETCRSNGFYEGRRNSISSFFRPLDCSQSKREVACVQNAKPLRGQLETTWFQAKRAYPPSVFEAIPAS